MPELVPGALTMVPEVEVRSLAARLDLRPRMDPSLAGREVPGRRSEVGPTLRLPGDLGASEDPSLGCHRGLRLGMGLTDRTWVDP